MVHGGQSLGNFHLFICWQAGEDNPRLIGIQIGQNQSYGLGVFILNEVCKLRRICFPCEIKGPHLQGGCEPADDLMSFFFPKCCFKHLPGIVDAPKVMYSCACRSWENSASTSSRRLGSTWRRLAISIVSCSISSSSRCWKILAESSTQANQEDRGFLPAG